MTPVAKDGKKSVLDARIHFPRLGFVVRPVSQQKL